MPQLDVSRDPRRDYLETYAKYISKQYDDLITWRTDDGYWYLEHICDEVQKALKSPEGERGGRLMLSMPPQHGKSITLGEWLPTWYMEQNPHDDILYVTYNRTYASQQGESVRDKVQKDAVDIKLANTKRKTRFRTDKGGEFFATGTGGLGGGVSADLVIFDDPYKNFAKAHSEDVREEVEELYANDLLPRISKDVTIIIIMTRWHSEDIIGWLLDKEHEKWTYLPFPAFRKNIREDRPAYLENPYDDRDKFESFEDLKKQGGNDQLLNPVDRPMHLIEDQFSAKTEEQFHAQYLQLPSDKHQSVDMWKYEDIEAARIPEGDIGAEQLEDFRGIVVAVDPSGGATDETGIVVCAVDYDDHGYILDDRSGKMDPADWADEVYDAYNEYNADKVVAESTYGGDMVDDVINRGDRRMNYKEVDATYGKKIRAQSVVARYQDQDVHHVGEFPELEGQMVSFTPGQKDSPDRMDAAVWGLKALLKSSRELYVHL